MKWHYSPVWHSSVLWFFYMWHWLGGTRYYNYYLHGEVAGWREDDEYRRYEHIRDQTRMSAAFVHSNQVNAKVDVS
ncbi:hypothetical protein GGR57DRAFT_466566 [Xylariaceae sp. FL1272]|nr:hypothetical protein GGR57DRAFT_466566 [Xylariaceae sp. FL1272]